MKKGIFIFFNVALLCCLEGCRERGDALAVRIYDGYTETRLNVREGITVGNVLETAEILLNDQDAVIPSLDTKITENGTAISIERCTDTEPMAEERTDVYQKESSKVFTNAEVTPEENEPGTQANENTKETVTEEPEIVSKEKVYDCDGSGHGYYYIKWSDGSEEYEDF